MMTLGEQAYQKLKGMLVGGQLKASAWLPVDDIAGELGISRQPVMDAIKRLSTERFIDVVPQVGSRVAKPDQRDIEDFYRLHAISEGFIAELCAVRAGASDIVELNLIADRIAAMANTSITEAKQTESYRLLNRKFHAEMRRISRSKSVADVVESFGDRSDFYVALQGASGLAVNLKEAHRELTLIIDSVAAGDQPGARQAMMAHIFATARKALGLSETASRPSFLSGDAAQA